tara:strand:+ start:843 stop:1496 length:654 start_codon:yes stop_codon:yes gene_type:complete
MSTQNSKNRPSPTQARAARRERRQNRRKFTRVFIGFAIGGVALLLILGLILPMLGNLGGSADADKVPDGPGKQIESDGQDHIDEGSEHPSYRTVPAASGWHYRQPLAPVSWGIHTEYIPEEKRIHNLEHGGISIVYSCAEPISDECKQLVESLTSIVDRAREANLKVVMSPYPGMATKIALTAWTFIDAFDEFDEDRIKDFINAHESSPNAPERYAN